jgi:hypothetical protein
MIPDFIVWKRNDDNSFRVYEYNTDTFKTVDNLKHYEMNHFELLDMFISEEERELDDEELLKAFSTKMINWRNEILNSTSLKKTFDYFDNSFICKDEIYFRNHSHNILTFLKKFMPEEYKTYEPIEIYEENYFLKCYRGGLNYGKIGIYNAITYDFSFFYPSIMSAKDYYVPTKKGQIKEFISEIPDNFKFGIYNIKIISDDENFNKVFSFSKDDHYTHYSLNFVLYYNETYDGNIKFDILSNTALIYDDKYLVSGSKLFYCWYCRLFDLKKELPNNKLIKKLASTAWGELQSQNVIVKTEDEINDEQLNIGFDLESDYYIKKIVSTKKTEKYSLIKISDNQTFYKYQLRMKAFLTDYGRIKIAKLALENINNVIRIQTDSITYDKNLKLNIANFKKDTKKCGKFEIKNSRIMSKIE